MLRELDAEARKAAKESLILAIASGLLFAGGMAVGHFAERSRNDSKPKCAAGYRGDESKASQQHPEIMLCDGYVYVLADDVVSRQGARDQGRLSEEYNSGGPDDGERNTEVEGRVFVSHSKQPGANRHQHSQARRQQVVHMSVSGSDWVPKHPQSYRLTGSSTQ